MTTSLTQSSYRRLKIMLAVHLAWLALVCLLVAWWGRVILTQAATIAELQGKLGQTGALEQAQRTKLMLLGESSTFIALLAGSTGLLFWLYRRDMMRVRQLHAFFASVTHELRTPLTSIRLQAESIAENLGENHDQKHLVDRLMEDTVRLESQVERTLELARLEGGGPVHVQPVHLQSWLQRFVSNWKATYGDKVTFDLDIQDVSIEADPAALGVIFRNLLENSLKHARSERVTVRIATELQGHSVLMRIKDNGGGFSGNAELLGQLFQKGPGSSGTGVGLYLVKVLMRRMGGLADFGTQAGFEVALRFRDGGQGV